MGSCHSPQRAYGPIPFHAGGGGDTPLIPFLRPFDGAQGERPGLRGWIPALGGRNDGWGWVFNGVVRGVGYLSSGGWESGRLSR